MIEHRVRRASSHFIGKWPGHTSYGSIDLLRIAGKQCWWQTLREPETRLLWACLGLGRGQSHSQESNARKWPGNSISWFFFQQSIHFHDLGSLRRACAACSITCKASATQANKAVSCTKTCTQQLQRPKPQIPNKAPKSRNRKSW